ncbi:MAG: radical SAM family heme chaperone HemW [Chthoniobacterales bacterium]|nr:radical SAM family heme chaperone HemW [Chthoniobacterales bacterium]
MSPAENVQRSTSNVQRSMADPVRHIYVHIPFCARICPYCAFYKVRADPAQTQRFCEALLRELEMLGPRFQIQAQTIFFGGGTPTALTTAQLEFLLSGFQERLNLSALAEWTTEANPGSVSARKAALLKQLGVSRISLGVQSWDDELLTTLGREHNSAQAEASYHVMRDAGFRSVSIDLMFGLPGQSLAQWQATLERTVSLRPDHISAYCLTYEEDTEFFLRQARGEYRPDVDTDAQFFESAMRILEGAGYAQYEISNYARPGHESAHNRGYWAGADYLGIGPSAFSTVGNERWQNVADYRAYSDRVLGDNSPVASVEPLTAQTKHAERIVLSLRTASGIPREWLDAWPTERQEFVQLGLLQQIGERYVLTPRGKLVADSVAAAFV